MAICASDLESEADSFLWFEGDQRVLNFEALTAVVDDLVTREVVAVQEDACETVRRTVRSLSGDGQASAKQKADRCSEMAGLLDFLAYETLENFQTFRWLAGGMRPTRCVWPDDDATPVITQDELVARVRDEYSEATGQAWHEAPQWVRHGWLALSACRVQREHAVEAGAVWREDRWVVPSVGDLMCEFLAIADVINQNDAAALAGGAVVFTLEEIERLHRRQRDLAADIEVCGGGVWVP